MHGSVIPGEYILSNQSGYDPNVGGSSSWTPLESGGSTSDSGSGNE
jgi:hypothetical protein